MGTDYSVLHAADLAAHLPQQSRCMVALNPELAYSASDYILAKIANDQALIAWSQGGKKGKKPDLVDLTGEKSDTQPQEQITSDDYRHQLSQSRREA